MANRKVIYAFFFKTTGPEARIPVEGHESGQCLIPYRKQTVKSFLTLYTNARPETHIDW